MEAALKMVRQYSVETGASHRREFIARRQSYHGNTLGALTAGGNAMQRALYAPMLSEGSAMSRPGRQYVAPCDEDDEMAANFLDHALQFEASCVGWHSPHDVVEVRLRSRGVALQCRVGEPVASSPDAAGAPQ